MKNKEYLLVFPVWVTAIEIDDITMKMLKLGDKPIETYKGGKGLLTRLSSYFTNYQDTFLLIGSDMTLREVPLVNLNLRTLGVMLSDNRPVLKKDQIAGELKDFIKRHKG